MTEDLVGYTERRLPSIMEDLRALSLPGLLPQACFDKGYATNANECLNRCLQTCVRISESINKHTAADDHAGASLTAYHEKLTRMISELTDLLKFIHGQDITAGLSDLMQRLDVSGSISKSPKQGHQQNCTSEDLYVNRFEDVYVARDGIQIISSTNGDLIQAKNITGGVGSLQCLGQLSDTSIQQVSRILNRPI